MISYLLIFVHVIPTNHLLVKRPDLANWQRRAQVAASDLSFGQRQVEQFICDLPGVGAIINGQPMLRFMLMWHFAGELKGSRVYWDCREPKGPPPAEHSPSGFRYPVIVRVSNKAGSPLDTCTMLLFELLNSDVDKEYQLLANAAPEDRKSRDDFAKSCVLSEFAALKRTQYFFLFHPASKVSFETDDYYIYLLSEQSSTSDYLRWVDTLDDKVNPLRFYADAYDDILHKRLQ